MRYLLIALIALAGNAQAEIIAPEKNHKLPVCGAKIKTKDVMVLDVESFGDDAESAVNFVMQQAGPDLQLLNKEPILIKTKMSTIFHRRKSSLKRARTEAAKRGCNLVVAVGAEAYETGRSTTCEANGNRVNCNDNVAYAAQAAVYFGTR